MLISMTGFGRSVRETSFGRLTVEIQSVNRKHLEILVSLPKEMGRYEMELRKWVAESISRGQVGVRLFLSPGPEALNRMLPNPIFLKSFKEAWVKLAKATGCDEKSVDLPFLMQTLAAWPQNLESEWDEGHLSLLQESFDEAMKAALVMKRLEGKSLAQDIVERLHQMERYLREIEQRCPDTVEKQRHKLQARMKELLAPGTELDERLLREVAFFAERVDIAEEITRLFSHFKQFHSVLQEKEARVGRKLDFLVQEIGREFNTIGSKSADAAISRLVVDAKSELEKIREQIQNVE